MTSEKYTVKQEERGMRIDKVLTSVLPDTSRSQIQTWIKEGYCLVNNKQVKSNYKCLANDIVTWEIPEPEPLYVEPENIPLDIIFEDQDVIVVNKPRGMVVHPSAGHANGTLVNALLYHCKDLSGINGVVRPGIVHRIDRDTSGLLMIAKNDQAHQHLAEQLQAKTVKRSYEAIVHGAIPHEYGTIEAPLGRDPKDRQKMAVISGGKPAITHFEVIDRFDDRFTYVKCVLETGRTHQIRVHMKYIGFPLVGDPKYGPRKTLKIDGQALHARELGFEHPRSNKWMHFEVAPPEIFLETLEKVKESH
ncbi:Ribosomal large subunit pseudouridine synthase D [Paraliobacillus sp. PM-2]|uniref:RluA family pseudouridine synthase n=1 Tax=Paraliobacillus sp. PM-2 TaxID=1462524 RepID=UPI00061C653F|nr:RluA family pseudouridine synthase [Paraliobacillus sp. PM-2]CQR47769.1 Ribosomal large subunit pseudouridine synthase D [Paraliobacillus sp. PM-2]